MINNTFKFILENKKLYYNYIIKSKIESGISLKGWEVKSFINKKVNITNSYIIVKNNEAFLINSIFYPTNSCFSFIDKNDISRNRKLLMHKHEINKLFGLLKISKITAVVLKMYFKNKFIKLIIGITEGKNKSDKRKSIKDREWNIKKMRILKNKCKI